MSGYYVVPNVSGNNASSPNAAPLQITGDIDIRVTQSTPSPVAGRTVLGRYDPTAQFRVYETSGVMRADFYVGGALKTIVSSISATSPSVKEWRFTRVAATGLLSAFEDGVAKGTQAATSGALDAGTDDLSIGARNAAGTVGYWGGNIYRIQILNGIGGTAAFDARFDQLSSAEVAAGSFTESSANAATVTINGAAWSYVFGSGNYALAGPGQLLVTGG